MKCFYSPTIPEFTIDEPEDPDESDGLDIEGDDDIGATLYEERESDRYYRDWVENQRDVV